MARIKIRYYVAKAGRRYWQPGQAAKALGFRAVPLKRGGDFLNPHAAMAAAEELNALLDAARLRDGAGLATALERLERGPGEARLNARALLPAAWPLDARPKQPRGGAPRMGDDYAGIKPGSVRAVIHDYRQSPRYKAARATTRADYDYRCRIVDRWAGDMPVAAIGHELVQDLYDKIAARHRRKANAVATMLSMLFRHAAKMGLRHDNPVALVDRQADRRRMMIWPDDAIWAFIAAADASAHPSIATAIMMSVMLGQREGDVLAMTWPRYQDGAFAFPQSKTQTYVRLDAIAPLADRLAALNAARDTRARAAHAIPPAEILICETTGKPWKKDHFRHAFAKLRSAVAREHFWFPDPRQSGGVKTEDLWFADLRTTAVVILGEIGIEDTAIAAMTGHTIDRAKAILEHYAVRTAKKARIATDALARHFSANKDTA